MDFEPPLELPPSQWAAIEAAYATPPRAYHNLDHVHEVLRHFSEVAAGPGWVQPGEVYLAVLYHDAIYEAGRTDNEERSAELARDHVGRWMAGMGIDEERVAELIRLTQRHGQLDVGSVDRDAALFLDCDMAILGAPPTVFANYDLGIDAEYRDRMPAWLFKMARRRFLKALLARERIYLSDFFHARLDAQARLNLKRAISS